tara:strand:+ start:1124 stop:1717 length:594 start_codon:yes stop_codon:yes gene_type:complete
MSSVRITGNASGSGILTFSAPNTNSDRTIDIPDKAGGLALGAGAIIQVVSVNLTSASTISSTGGGSTFTDVSGLSASITPASTSNKILVIADTKINGKTGVNTCTVRVLRGSTAFYVGDAGSSRPQTSSSGLAVGGDAGVVGNFIVALDSPSSTSSTTYKIQAGSNDTMFVNRTPDDTDNANNPRTASSITLIEVQG